jgi:hypothetical protein
MREEKGKFSFPAGRDTFLSNGLPFGGWSERLTRSFSFI